MFIFHKLKKFTKVTKSKKFKYHSNAIDDNNNNKDNNNIHIFKTFVNT